MNTSRICRQSLACIAAALMAHAAQAQLSTQFTYQGDLQSEGMPANGQFQLRISAFDGPLAGTQLGSQIITEIDVVDGKFTTVLDFGTLFSNTNVYLELGVRPSGQPVPYTNLWPRQRLTATPNALFASTAGTATTAVSANTANSANTATTATNATQLGGQAPTFYQDANNLTAGTIPDARLGATVGRTNATQTYTGANTFSNPANSFAGVGSGLTGLNASNITTGTLANARTTGSVAALPNTLILRDSSGGAVVNMMTVQSINGNGQFLFNLDASTIALGTLSAARLPATVARTDIANNFGALTNTFGGSVGIGTTTPGAPLHVGGTGPWHGIFGSSTVGATQLLVGASATTNGYAMLQGIKASGSLWGDLVMNLNGGRVGIGNAAPAARLHVQGDSNIATIVDSNATTGTWLAINNRADVNNGRYWNLISTGTANGVGAGNLLFAVGNSLGVADAIPMTITRTGRVGIGTSAPSTELHVVGTTRTNVLEIMGGSDIAEPYFVAPSEGVAPEPGMVVSIDPDHVGKLRVSSSAYDTTVAGIVSGANGVNVGLTLRQEGSKVADGSLPIANVGRVWCRVDADAGAIQPGDLLTTSDTPGHAMKADPAKANGAILGKAMSRLESGKGMVLVLVGLQ